MSASSSAVVRREHHPARFSKEIVDAFRDLLPAGIHVHDPFGGDGVRLGHLCTELGLTFSGTEIEPEFIIDTRVRKGDSTKARTYPRQDRWPYWIVTSPVYPNGMADHWEAKDKSKRKTYRWVLAQLLGYDRPLHKNNQARYGYRGTKRGGRSIKRSQYWRIARECAEHWVFADRIVLNVSDFMHSNTDVEPAVQDWIDMLVDMGWKIERDIDVSTRRYKNGSDESRDQRVEHERVIVFQRA